MSDLNQDELEAAIRKAHNRMRGHLAGLIESWGLNAQQERGCISTMKSMSYDAENQLVELIRQ